MKYGGEAESTCSGVFFYRLLMVACFMQITSNRTSQSLCSSAVETTGVTSGRFLRCLFACEPLAEARTHSSLLHSLSMKHLTWRK